MRAGVVGGDVEVAGRDEDRGVAEAGARCFAADFPEPLRSLGVFFGAEEAAEPRQLVLEDDRIVGIGPARPERVLAEGHGVVGRAVEDHCADPAVAEGIGLVPVGRGGLFEERFLAVHELLAARVRRGWRAVPGAWRESYHIPCQPWRPPPPKIFPGWLDEKAISM